MKQQGIGLKKWANAAEREYVCLATDMVLQHVLTNVSGTVAYRRAYSLHHGEAATANVVEKNQ
jgi:hypothetical protein